MQIRNCFKTIALFMAAVSCLNATEYHGIVKFGGLPVPGATITAVQGDKKVIAVTDQLGAYSFSDLADGTWNIDIEMLCFEPIKQDVTIAAGVAAGDFELKLLPFDQIKASAVAPEPPAPSTGLTVTPSPNPAAPTDNKKSAKGAAPAANPNGSGGFQRTQANATANAPAADAPAPPPASDSFAGQSASDLSSRANDGFLVNGTSNNGASSPFALNSAFGNNRRGARSLYNGNIGFTIDNSNFDARTFSITGQDTEKPAYNKFTGIASFGGPLKIPHLLKNGPNIFVNYQWVRNRNASLGTGLMPTPAEREGDFSAVPGLGGKPLALIDPTNGLPFQGNMIPSMRISPQAQALLNLYPQPNFTGSTAFNYQIPLVSPQHIDNMQSRFQKTVGRKDVLSGGYAFSSSRQDTPTILGFLDTSDTLGQSATMTWTHRFTNRLNGTATETWSRQSNTNTPFFANRENVSGEAGIEGNNQQAINFGPPSLNFSSGVQGLSDGVASIIHNQTNALTYQMYWNRGRHNITYGAGFTRQQFNSFSQQNPRGNFSFTGAASGSDFADFLLGVPDAEAIAFGNADKYFRDSLYSGFVQDDWRISPGFTLNLGVRWEYNGPITELYGRLVNLDVAPEYTAVAPVVASDPIGPLTGMHYPDSLVHPDKHAFMPRVALSWRPLPASSLVVRANFGMYYNTSVYQSIATLMAQQSPLSKSTSIQNTAATPLTLATGFDATPLTTPNTFAIDPNFKVGYTDQWAVSVQRDLPWAMIMTATYTGIKGTRNPQEFYPNTYAIGAENPCPTCPSGFGFVTSNGNSTREAGQIDLRRRQHNGFQAEVKYTYSKSIDDSALGGGGIGGLMAQNWLDLSGERALSTFDQRHLVNITGQYTSGMGIGGGTLVNGWRGTLLKEWTILTAVNVGTGFPLTPSYPFILPGTGAGVLRPEYTGVSVYDAPPGLSLNAAAYAAPPPGQFGNAGRDSITGPSMFNTNASLARTFRLTDRLNLSFSIAANNPLNHVTYPAWNTTFGSSQFGLPSTANAMRSVLTRVILRF
jgi:hypothetical protein